MNKTKIITMICWIISAVTLTGLVIWFVVAGPLFSLGNGIPRFGFGGWESLTGSFEEQGTYSVPIDGLDSMHIDWTAGNVTIRSYDTNEIQITEFSQRELRDNEQFRIHTEGSTIKVDFSTRRLRGLQRMPQKNLEVIIPYEFIENIDVFTVTTVSAHVDIEYLNSTNLNVNTVSGAGCTAGWNRVVLPNSTQQGYICRDFFRIEGVDPTPPDRFGRPWMTPRESIIGGAIFIGESYINRGQFTSYLKKFNVNPNAHHPVHNHQYMMNIRAPRNESRMSYTAYNNAGLLNLPLRFSIPVFNNMPAETNLFNESRTNTGVCSNRNVAFEDSLRAQGFPQSYVNYLGCLHLLRPNWHFEIMQTGLDWNHSVERQRMVGAIDSTDTRLCHAYSSGCHRTEPGWFRPTTAATAYFLDPRNFLDERHILQFQILSFSDHFSESHVQTVLNPTFMYGRSPMDGNRTYASIFIEAGQRANVNPIHLASLSRNELGSWRMENGVRTIPIAARGLRFTYRGVTYEGLFNFYNIGAFSSSSNPVLRGLVWASGCAPEAPCPLDGSGGTTQPPVVSGDIVNYLIGRGFRINGSNISGIAVGTTPTQLRNSMPNFNIAVNNSNGVAIGVNNPIGTGNIITVSDDEGSVTLNVVIIGDVTGTGVIGSVDMLAIRQHLLGIRTLSGPFAAAADVTRSGSIGSVDMLAIRQHLLGQRAITQ